MKALTWQGTENVSVEEVPDPRIEQPNDAIIKVTSTAICGSDLHLYEVLGPFLHPGDVLGHETMGIVEEVGPEAGDLQVGDRVVVPFNISCGHCWMCSRGLFAQCETTQDTRVRQGRVAVRLHRPVRRGAGRPGRVPARAAGAVRPGQGARRGAPTSGTSTSPTSCRRPGRPSSSPMSSEGQTLAVLRAGPDRPDDGADRAERRGRGSSASTSCPSGWPWPGRGASRSSTSTRSTTSPQRDLELTGGRGADGTVDAVGMEAHGNPVAEKAIAAVGLLPDAAGQAGDRQARDRPARGADHRDQVGAPRRHGVGQRRLRRRGRPACR